MMMKFRRTHLRWVIGISTAALLFAGLGVLALQAVRLRQLAQLVTAHGGSLNWHPSKDDVPRQLQPLTPLPFWQSPELLIVQGDQLREVGHALGRGYGLGDRVTGLYLVETSFSESDFSALPPLPELELLAIGQVPIAPAVLPQLDRFPSLTSLIISECALDDGQLAGLPVLPELENLILIGTQVDAAGLAQVARLPKLLHLILSDTSVGNEEIAVLADCRQLRQLDLDNTFIDDGAVEYLLQLPLLESLSVSNTGISDVGLARLAEKFPDLEVWDD